MTPHGTRRLYQSGCRCFRCRVANAAYISNYRHRQKAGAVILGARIASDHAARLLKQLCRDGIQKTQIAHALGLRSPVLKVHDHITVRRYMKIKRVHRRYLSEASE